MPSSTDSTESITFPEETKVKRKKIIVNGFNLGVKFEYRTSIRLIAFHILTLGWVYHIYLVHNWLKTINKVQKKELFNPGMAVIATIATLGAAGIYFDYIIVKRSQEIARKTGGKSYPDRKDITPPSKNLSYFIAAINIIFFYFLRYFF